MCFGPCARPPLPPIAGGAGPLQGEDIVLQASDGNRFAAFSARAATAGGPGIVILPDVRGLHHFYRELALRFAEAGVHATAIDYFGRTAGIGVADARGDDFDYRPHLEHTSLDTVALDTAAAVEHIRSSEGGAAAAMFTVGFCFGGRHSFNQAAQGHGLAGVIGFYGMPQQRSPEDTNAPINLVESYACPVLGLFGGDDHAMTPADAGAFRQALDAAGVRNEIVVLEGAPHSFFDRTYDHYRRESDESWRLILRFIRDLS